VSEQVFALRALGSYHLGGSVVRLAGKPAVELSPVPGSPRITVDPNGSFLVGQMYVQYARLVSARSPFPLLLWHGGGLTGACWESTPDARAGWQSFFLAAGLDVLVCDAVERGRAGWARFPDFFPGEPFFMPQQSAWTLYRVGRPDGFAEDPVQRRGFPKGRFPLGAFDEFTRQIVPRWSGNDALIQAAYDALIAREGPCLLLAHSQGAGFAVRAALRAPDRIKALVLVEPGGAPEMTAGDLDALAAIPMFALWGDNVDAVPFWTAARQKSMAIIAEVRRRGGDATAIDLPAEGVHGNSHLLMMDTNSDEIAERVQQWLSSRGLLAASVIASPAAPPCRP
jgi:pimeloyl-ACP methyl ester carboxylesterase